MTSQGSNLTRNAGHSAGWEAGFISSSEGHQERTLLYQREVRPWSPYAAHASGLDSGLNHLLQRTCWKQLKTSECWVDKDDCQRYKDWGGGLGEGEGGQWSQQGTLSAWRPLAKKQAPGWVFKWWAPSSTLTFPLGTPTRFLINSRRIPLPTSPTLWKQRFGPLSDRAVFLCACPPGCLTHPYTHSHWGLGPGPAATLKATGALLPSQGPPKPSLGG